ncbi:MAG: di-heme enzyme [Sideroxydans sp.]|nr:di-heme enzyme [Sideroxydans sp.]
MRTGSMLRRALLAAACLLLLGAGGKSAWQWDKPDWVPDPVVPADNPMSAAKVELGRHLFYDKRLSADLTMSCASCHIQAKAFTDGKALSPGVDKKDGVRSAMMLANVAYLPVLTWANPNMTRLEQQMLTPIFGINPTELGMEGKEKELFARLAADPKYPAMFKKAFPEEKGAISLSTLTKAIASFERTLISFDSPYDRYKYGGDMQAISEQAKRGEALFFGEDLECSHCHGGFTFNDNVQHTRLPYAEVGFHNTGMYNMDGKGMYRADNHGIRDVTGAADDEGKFRTASLRNIAVTAPYMHDGSLLTLRDVIRKHYAVKGMAVSNGQAPSPLRDNLIEGFAVTDAQVADLVAFLETLTDAHFLSDPKLSDPFVKQ